MREYLTIPFARSFKALFEACLLLKGLWETLVVERWECTWVGAILALDPLKRYGRESSLEVVNRLVE